MLHRRKGTTLLEVMATLGLFSIIMVVTAMLFRDSLKVWRSASSTDTAHRELRKARAQLERDLILSDPAMLVRAPVPPSLGGGGNDGEALCFLSPVDPVSGAVMRLDDGTAFWQRNVLYYLVVPIGDTCAGGVGPNGYDDRCPHKLLIRKEIDLAPATVPTDPTTIETLVPSLAPFLTRPSGFSVAGLSEPGVTEVKIAAAHLLAFSSVSAPPPENLATEVAVDLRAVAVDEALREVAVGTVPLSTGPFTLQSPFSAFLKN